MTFINAATTSPTTARTSSISKHPTILCTNTTPVMSGVGGGSSSNNSSRSNSIGSYGSKNIHILHPKKYITCSFLQQQQQQQQQQTMSPTAIIMDGAPLPELCKVGGGGCGDSHCSLNSSCLLMTTQQQQHNQQQQQQQQQQHNQQDASHCSHSTTSPLSLPKEIEFMTSFIRELPDLLKEKSMTKSERNETPSHDDDDDDDDEDDDCPSKTLFVEYKRSTSTTSRSDSLLIKEIDGTSFAGGFYFREYRRAINCTTFVLHDKNDTPIALCTQDPCQIEKEYLVYGSCPLHQHSDNNNNKNDLTPIRLEDMDCYPWFRVSDSTLYCKDVFIWNNGQYEQFLRAVPCESATADTSNTAADPNAESDVMIVDAHGKAYGYLHKSLEDEVLATAPSTHGGSSSIDCCCTNINTQKPSWQISFASCADPSMMLCLAVVLEEMNQ